MTLFAVFSGSFGGLVSLEPLAKADCVRRSRVVLAPVAGVKSCGGNVLLNRAGKAANSRDDGDKNEFVAGESAE
jgi:hypothetical protein